jgi:outer membrane murein-binding lipoprotein Lpp
MTYKTKHEQLRTEIATLNSDIDILKTTLYDVRELVFAALNDKIENNTALRTIVMITLQAERWTDNENE